MNHLGFSEGLARYSSSCSCSSIVLDTIPTYEDEHEDDDEKNRHSDIPIWHPNVRMLETLYLLPYTFHLLLIRVFDRPRLSDNGHLDLTRKG